MLLSGNDLIEKVTNDTFVHQTWTAADQATIVLDTMFTFVQKHLDAGDLLSVETLVSGDEPIYLALETNLVNLPIRYANQLGKIVINDPEAEVNLYMYVEHPLVTHSGMRIELAASVAAYLDDPDSVNAKISEFYNRELQTINEAVLAATEMAAADDDAAK